MKKAVKVLLSVFAIMLVYLATIVYLQSNYAVMVQESNVMVPTISHGDELLVRAVKHSNFSPARWDIVLFQFPKLTNALSVMRVVGLEGESIVMSNNCVKINGLRLILPTSLSNVIYRTHIEQKYAVDSPLTIPNGHVFVLGDNSDRASDSRFWGPLETKRIIGVIVKTVDASGNVTTD